LPALLIGFSTGPLKKGGQRMQAFPGAWLDADDVIKAGD
jgi:hypothetical protein